VSAERQTRTADASSIASQRSSGNSAKVRGAPDASSKTSIALRQAAACDA